MDLARKQFITDTIKFFVKTYPEEWQAGVKRAKKMRKATANVFGSDKQKELRFEFTIPVRLYNMIDRILDSPKFLHDKDEANWFARTVKQLRVPEKW